MTEQSTRNLPTRVVGYAGVSVSTEESVSIAS